MTDHMIQVPVSLIKRLQTVRSDLMKTHGRTYDVLDELAAALSQQSDDELDRLHAEREEFVSEAWEQAAKIAEQDAMSTTMLDMRQFSIVQATGQRIAFNIRATQNRNHHD